MADIQELARQAYGAFEQSKRDDGTEFWHTTQDASDWLRELCRIAHGDMFPDDWRYEFIVRALSAIADDGDDATVEPDVYTHDLTAWLHSRTDRVYYLTEALENGGITDGFQLLSAAQNMELVEVFYAVRDYLSDAIDDAETD